MENHKGQGSVFFLFVRGGIPVRSYKPHELHYLTSARLLFTQKRPPDSNKKLDDSLETMGREDGE